MPGGRFYWLYAAMTGCVVGREQHALVLPLVVRDMPSCFCLQETPLLGTFLG